jgi:predicted dehydrogenase
LPVERVGIGIIGCGTISEDCLRAAPSFPVLDVRAVADIWPAAASARAEAFGLRAVSVEKLLADPSIDLVVSADRVGTLERTQARTVRRNCHTGMLWAAR